MSVISRQMANRIYGNGPRGNFKDYVVGNQAQVSGVKN
jgi:hypothetical protein